MSITAMKPNLLDVKTIKTMEKKFINITEDEFYEKYNPVKNHLVPDAAFDGFMFETYGKELEYIQSHKNKQQIWTIIEVDGNFYFVSGYHFVDRFGYLLTEELVEEGVEIEVKLNTEIDE